MKKIIFFIFLLAIAFSSISQQIVKSPELTKQDHIQKSKSQKITARILLGGGSAIILTGLLINTSYALVNIGDNPNSSKGLWLVYTGLAASISSIPLFIASAKNKRKANSLSFNFQKGLQVRNNTITQISIPAVILKINL